MKAFVCIFAVMNLNRQIFSWIAIVVFLTSTTGVSVYEHICHTSAFKSIGFNQVSCDLDQPSSKDCCSKPKKHSDCCEKDASFQKYHPNGNIEQTLLVKLFNIEKLLPSTFISQIYWASLNVFNNNSSKKNAPPEDIIPPKTLLERLAFIQAYLC